MITHRHYQELPLASAGQVPEWVHLIPAGVFKGADGRGPFHVADAQALIRASMADGKLTLDENHATDTAAPTGGASPAHAWIVELQSRADGIWGRTDWNPSGVQLMTNKSYRGISPVFTADKKTGAVVRLLRAALTNTPNLPDLAALHSTQETTLDLAALRRAMGLPDTADDAAILAHAEQTTRAVAMHSTQLVSIARAAGAAETVTPDGLVTHLNAVKAAGTELQTMAGKVVALETELNAVKADGARKAAVSYIDGAIAAGKPLVALRDHYIARHMADAASVEREVGVMLSINAGGMGSPAKPELNDEGEDMSMSAEDKEVCSKFGQDPKAFVKERNARLKAKKEGM